MKRRTPLYILASGIMMVAILAGIGFFALNPEQCPEGYTQAQINASDCIIGASIGQGLMLFAAILVAVVSLAVAVAVYIAQKRHH